MNGVCLTFYVSELRKHKGVLLYEWILEEAKRIGVKGGTALKGIAGFGQQGEIHEEHFFELGSNVPIHIEFIVTEEEARELLDALEKKKVNVFHTKYPVEYGGQ